MVQFNEWLLKWLEMVRCGPLIEIICRHAKNLDRHNFELPKRGSDFILCVLRVIVIFHSFVSSKPRNNVRRTSGHGRRVRYSVLED